MQRRAFKLAFQKTLPIMAGFIFLAGTYGIYMHQNGFNFLYPTLMAATIFGGSVEFVIANLLLGKFDPWLVLFLTLIINSRHLFYGISMLDKYRGAGLKKIFLMFGMCDETFVLNYSIEVPNSVDRRAFMFYVTLLDYAYWVFGAFLGGVLGGLIPFKIPGIEFVMTALFLVLFANQFMNEKNHFSSIVGIIWAILALFVFGGQLFLVISMTLMVITLAIKFRREAAK
ncbi:AzlC family ABC transporter permease (plasmid) [Nicoliella spurrieriana]|uniref:AzlC family ABC transporter permease n=1 Tax=Nicoliella spurrieriana TaxID=2925830 RepID=A0A976X4W1_9LACO|nr:AzlC family ABC transporter permease [Nicoliella spurrieriana]UQS85937.1 AzlC family ABC transporter permease [Nicoliella spurrieriana]